jgi:hypothetical protein
MKLFFSPEFNATRRITAASVAGDVLHIHWRETRDGAWQDSDMTLDLAPLGEGDVLPAEAVTHDGVPVWWLTGPLTRTDGHVCMTLRYPHGHFAPHETRFPEPVTVTGGDVPLPDAEGDVPAPVLPTSLEPQGDVE